MTKDLTKLTKAELIKIIETPVVEPEVTKACTFFNTDSKYSAAIRSSVLDVVELIKEDKVTVCPAISKYNFDNFVTHGLIKSGDIKRAVNCNATTMAELDVWLQHVSTVLVHELTKTLTKTTFKG